MTPVGYSEKRFTGSVNIGKIEQDTVVIDEDEKLDLGMLAGLVLAHELLFHGITGWGDWRVSQSHDSNIKYVDCGGGFLNTKIVRHGQILSPKTCKKLCQIIGINQ